MNEHVQNDTGAASGAAQSSRPQSNFLVYLRWLRRLLLFWVKPEVLPEDWQQELQIDKQQSVCYILNFNSLSDLLVLDSVCRRLGLPRPHQRRAALQKGPATAYIYLNKIGLLTVARAPGKEPPTPLQKLVEMAHSDAGMEVKFVPVSVFWGRAPATSVRSWFKLLFFDDEHAGVLQKFFIVLAHGRNTLVQFGKPISLRTAVNEGLGPAETARKLRRVLRVHFRHKRNATTGPMLPGRAAVVAKLLRSKNIREAIQEEARKKKIPEAKAERRAQAMLMEIAADIKPAAVRLYDIVLAWVWNRVFKGIEFSHTYRIREAPPGAELVFLPSHRSHMDYILLAYSLYHQGLWVPHTAAGVNLDFWPAGPILRRAGAFYLRRSFGGNRLYTTVFNEYVHYLLTAGHMMNFFIEGGRSRTGRLLQPKTGMLAMVLQSYVRNHQRPIVIFPTYVGYDKVIEVGSYLSELRGSAKRKESFGDFLKLGRILRIRLGKAYINLGEPIVLGDYLNAHHPSWQNETVGEGSERPRWMSEIVNKMAQDTMTRINRAAVVSPSGLVALVLLSTSQRAMGEDELLFMMDKFLRIMRDPAYDDDVVFPKEDVRTLLTMAMGVAKIERFQHQSGDVIHMNEQEGITNSYYRNNILHLLALPAMVASFFQHNDKVSRAFLLRGGAIIYPFLQHDFFLPWSRDELEARLGAVIDALVREGLLQRSGDDFLGRPDIATSEFSALKILSRVLGSPLERYAIAAAHLLQFKGSASFKRDVFEQSCQRMAQRIALLSGNHEPDFADKATFKAFVDRLKELGFAKETSDGLLEIDQSTLQTAESAMQLLSADVRQSITRSFTKGQSAIAP